MGLHETHVGNAVITRSGSASSWPGAATVRRVTSDSMPLARIWRLANSVEALTRRAQS